MLARLEICRECPLVQPRGELMACGVCGCSVADSGLFNLARFVETEKYGCKYGEEKLGYPQSKWAAAGLSGNEGTDRNPPPPKKTCKKCK